MDARALLVFLGIGLLAGFLASLIVGGSGLLTYLLSGVIGSFVGGYLFSALNINLGIRNDLVRQIITSTVGAIIVLLVARLIAG
ncbi:MAG TPA: GlsB/YeaQ/YmgE family stress response membrane protein [Devosiaceae bacterium]|nr:GlsB/YeaQ/YmgE family stress response membrane protein [Devosiaceae bacterium]